MRIVTLVTSFTYQTTRSIDHFNFTKIDTWRRKTTSLFILAITRQNLAEFITNRYIKHCFRRWLSISYITYKPVQLPPLRRNPAGHWQEYEPRLFTQVALTGHSWANSLHSLKSTKKNVNRTFVFLGSLLSWYLASFNKAVYLSC